MPGFLAFPLLVLPLVFAGDSHVVVPAECDLNWLLAVSEWEVSVAITNSYEQEMGPPENRSVASHALRLTGSVRASTKELDGFGGARWEGEGTASMSIDRTASSVLVNPQGGRIEIQHVTNGAGTSPMTVWFFLDGRDETYSVNALDAVLEAITVSTQRTLFPDGGPFREDTEEKTELFPLSGAVFDQPLTGECHLSGSEVQGPANNINHKRIEWTITPVEAGT